MIPRDLKLYFHDSTIVIQSWDEEKNNLRIRIEKEIGPEVGIISLFNVSFICMPACFVGEGFKACPVSEFADDFWSSYTGVRNDFDIDDIAFQFESQDGPVYVVVAKGIEYEITQQDGCT